MSSFLLWLFGFPSNFLGEVKSLWECLLRHNFGTIVVEPNQSIRLERSQAIRSFDFKALEQKAQAFFLTPRFTMTQSSATDTTKDR